MEELSKIINRVDVMTLATIFMCHNHKGMDVTIWLLLQGWPAPYSAWHLYPTKESIVFLFALEDF